MGRDSRLLTTRYKNSKVLHGRSHRENAIRKEGEEQNQIKDNRKTLDELDVSDEERKILYAAYDQRETYEMIMAKFDVGRPRAKDMIGVLEYKGLVKRWQDPITRRMYFQTDYKRLSNAVVIGGKRAKKK